MVATMNDTHPVLKELLTTHVNASKLEPIDIEEEIPQKRDVELLFGVSKAELRPLSVAIENDLLMPPKHDVDDELDLTERTSDTQWLSEGDSSVSSVFSLSKLYGREEEEAKLIESYERITKAKIPKSPEYVLISGACGTGKTSLGESLRRRVAARGGFFCTGKFDQHQTDPHSPLCSAFSDFVSQVLDQDEDVIQEFRHRIRSAVERDLCALMTMIPSLRDLMCGDDTVPKDEASCTRCSEKKGRSNFAMLKLMRCISSPDRPVVMMLDDLQWAGESPFEKLKAMVLDDMNDAIMFLGISRDDVPPDSNLSNFLRQIEDERTAITNISLRNLELESVAEMVNDYFAMPEPQADALARFVFEHSSGNSFFVAETLRMVQQEPRFLRYDDKTLTWVVNSDVADQMCAQCPISFMERKLRTIPREVQKIFMVASCLGSNINERLIRVALQEPVEERFAKIVEHRKFLYDERSKTYSFRHNAFQTACYRLIAEEIRPAYHLEIGLRLWKHLESAELDENIFVVLNQLKLGASLMRDQSVRYEIAGLCILAAEKAAVSLSFSAASDYLNLAFSLLGTNHWDEAYELSIALYNYAAEVEFSVADSNRVDFLLAEVLEHARDFSDKIQAYSTKVYVFGVRGKTDLALKTGICVLKKLGIHLPTKCHKLNLIRAMSHINRKLKGKSDQSLKRLPRMTCSNKLAAMQILNLLFLNTYLGRRDMFPFIVLKMMKLTVEDGISAMSSVAFAGYGTLLCFAGQINEGLRYGRIALEMVDEFGFKAFQARCDAFVWGCIFVHARPFVESLDQLKEGHRLGLQTGDTEFAMLNAHLHILFLVESGVFPLSEVLSRAREVKELTQLHGHSGQLGVLNPLVGGLSMIIDRDSKLLDHVGEMDQGLQLAVENRNSFAVAIIYTTKLFICVARGDYESGLMMIDNRMQWLPRMNGSIHESLGLYLEGLTAFGAARRAQHANQKKKLVKRARTAMRFLKRLSKHNPSSCLAKYTLLEADYAAVMNKHALAEEKYSHAIVLASKYGSYYELAFSNQVAGEHFIADLGDTESGAFHLKNACQAYEDWGAMAAVSHLKQRLSLLARQK